MKMFSKRCIQNGTIRELEDKSPNFKLGVHSFTKKAGRDKNAVRNVQTFDGILLPRFRLPTEAEWEFVH